MDDSPCFTFGHFSSGDVRPSSLQIDQRYRGEAWLPSYDLTLRESAWLDTLRQLQADVPLLMRWYLLIDFHGVIRFHSNTLDLFLCMLAMRVEPMQRTALGMCELAHTLQFLASVVSQSFLAFGDILELHRKFIELSGGVNWIFELEELLDAAQSDENAGASSKSNEESEDVISLLEVDIIIPMRNLRMLSLFWRLICCSSSWLVCTLFYVQHNKDDDGAFISS
ncbi:unnamed protein product [Lactuca saligna]|uniref:Uncharacterized protein n=1 Tax=Lactuca saligna TaxID=75948 RepID=A0AA36E9E3_LACSI|nr:unnamed protein product [Lactuca saligna]